MNRTQTTIRLPSELKEQLQKQADEMGYSFNGMVIEAIQTGLEVESRRALSHKQKCKTR